MLSKLLLIVLIVGVASCASPTIHLETVAYDDKGTTIALSRMTITGNHLFIEDPKANVSTAYGSAIYEGSKTGFWTLGISAILGPSIAAKPAVMDVTVPVAAGSYMTNKYILSKSLNQTPILKSR